MIKKNLKVKTEDVVGLLNLFPTIVRALNDKQGITKAVDQCQRKLKHLKNLYKEKKDWNRKQWGKYSKEPPLRCHRRGARLQGCNNLQ